MTVAGTMRREVESPRRASIHPVDARTALSSSKIAGETFSEPKDSDTRACVPARNEARIAATLVADKTTGGNLRWATDFYSSLGPGFETTDELTEDCTAIIGSRPILIRTERTKQDKVRRTRAQAEVFTPSWVCNEQINLIDVAWFGGHSPFNDCSVGGWKTNPAKVEFPQGLNWKDYVDKRVLEVSCGEAPYLVSRYDAVTGDPIPLEERIGLLDRKLRVVRENASDSDEWDKWTMRAFEATYGFDLQGDNVLLARENLLASFDDHSELRPGGLPASGTRQAVANVISWNIFQMDGRTFEAPCASRPAAQMSLFENETEAQETEPIPCVIYDWRARRPVEYRTLLRR